MAKIFSVTPTELNTLNNRNADNHNHLDSYSDTSYPSTPTDTHSSDPFASHFRPLKSTSTSTSTARGRVLSKIVLSFFLSPTGYRLLRFDTKSKSKKGKSTATPADSSSVSKKKSKKASVTVSHKSLQRLGTSLVDPEEYEQWFKSQTGNDNNKLSIDDDHRGDNNKQQVNRNVATLSSATRAGIRGFTLAFLAGTAMDVLLPALLKQKFKGLVRRIFTNPSSLRLGASCGLFAFVYKLSFHIIALALEFSSQDQRTPTSRRSDSGIGLGDRQRRGQHGNGKIVFGGLTQLDSEDDENQQHSESDDDTLPISPKEQVARNRKKWVPALLASLVAAPAYSLIPEKARRLTMALYFLTYAGESAYAALEHEGLLKWLPSWVGIWILAPISTSQIVHTFIQHNDCSPMGWTKLIMSQCDPFLHRPKGFDTKTLGAFPTSGQLFEGAKAYMKAGYQSQPILASTATAAAAALTGDGNMKRFLLPEACESAFRFTESMGHHSVGCQMFHPAEASCGTAMKKLLGRNAVFSFKMYAVLAALTFVARGGNVFQKGVMNYVSKTTIATLRSTIATWGIVVTAFPLFCSMDRTLPTWFFPTKRHYINGFLGGLWVLIETPARQSALTLYFTRFMIEALWRRAVKAGWARKVKGGETVLFGCAMAVVMGVFETTPSMTRKTIIQSMLNKIFVD
ncbi:hypothetical protein BG015_000785 [Linnemannia schmuckeri]|uniref:Transmembrane protein 135 N-terminal domain-containing protein n=1 Tax=Linnemannia schmuckeri TaxID=64567 RepID=A0A9P5S4P8_9FUNG|nr:hypothetical protein BG015_000785 [Linnemannia schmuckeri]